MALITAELSAMGRKKSEERKHTAMMRIDPEVLDQAKLAASLMKMSLADYSSDVLRKAAERDITREARKLAGNSEKRTEAKGE